jgi:hypothetical protein
VHPFACTAHVSTPVLTHRVAAAVHAFVQHDADPALPVHDPLVHGASVVPYAQQPLLPFVQVASSPDSHAVSPDWQLSVHVSEHVAFGAWPEHDCGEVHGVVNDTKRQPFVSVEQATSV